MRGAPLVPARVWENCGAQASSGGKIRAACTLGTPTAARPETAVWTVFGTGGVPDGGVGTTRPALARELQAIIATVRYHDTSRVPR